MRFFSFLRYRLKSWFDAIHNKKLQKDILNALPFWLGAFITGIIAVLYAKLFSLVEAGTHFLFHHAGWSFFIITPICFLVAWWLVIKFAPFSRGSGIPQVSAAIELANPKHYYKVDSLLSLKVILIKIISSLIMVLGGGVVGREGPTIQISASIFKKINDFLPDWYPKISKRNMIVTGAASGLAAAFNTPLGGIVFAIEELTKTHFSLFKSALLTGVIIAGLTALHFLGPYLYLGYPALNNISTWIIASIVPLAIITGFTGCGMSNIILFVFRKKNTLTHNYQKVIYIIACGLIIAGMGYFIDNRTFGSGKEIMVSTLFSNDKHLEWYMPILRIIGPIVSFSVGGSGGVFAPALSAGASIGAVMAGWLHLSATETNLMVLCGMGGFLTGVTRSPFTSSILVIEMTNSHNIIFYIMLATLLASLIANLMSKHTFYDYLKMQYIDEIHKSEVQQDTAKE
ncbi:MULTISPECIES: chloride channel protein [unclassified Arcicella]|uniref:chloride channel protein n=1 Tax=unclassified Arcicella TaxID=2644986 RepID=UPI00285581C0|nr:MULTISPECIES: chloride channel protein [unclassified Arcicella]MDR6560617.1 H+/Cl- antiporter ClcA [Arcicella sp. BE51]MDR6810501.1 H+/Cl- antiporter ClcA [Arcicella sp. BE140]MDR6821851.1 H+/Cl- antiporter ClcA [Arcicella sp. BE139]